MRKQYYWAIVSKENGFPLSNDGQFCIYTSRTECDRQWAKEGTITKKHYKRHKIEQAAIHGLVTFHFKK
jgi:hypothetical protein